jgi:hypothetical protein
MQQFLLESAAISALLCSKFCCKQPVTLIELFTLVLFLSANLFNTANRCGSPISMARDLQCTRESFGELAGESSALAHG